MDFSFTDEQEAVRELAARIFADGTSHERMQELEAGEWFDGALWNELAKANLTAIALPEEVADLIVFLASARASYISGTIVTLDGGKHSDNSIL